MNHFSSSWRFLVHVCVYTFFFSLFFLIFLFVWIRLQSWCLLENKHETKNDVTCVMDKISSLVWNTFFFFPSLYFSNLCSTQSWCVTIIGYWWCFLVSSRIHVACFVNKIWPFGMSAATIKKHCFVPVVEVWSFFFLPVKINILK